MTPHLQDNRILIKARLLVRTAWSWLKTRHDFSLFLIPQFHNWNCNERIITITNQIQGMYITHYSLNSYHKKMLGHVASMLLSKANNFATLAINQWACSITKIIVFTASHIWRYIVLADKWWPRQECKKINWNIISSSLPWFICNCGKFHALMI